MDFYIMSKDIITAKWQGGVFEVIDENLLPLYLKNTGNVQKWLETRAIDSHRANSRLLKKALRLTEKDDFETVISVNAATVTDCYWIKPINSSLTYEEVRFDDDYFSNLALTGSYDSFNKALISRGYPKNIKRKNDILVKLFNELVDFDSSLEKYIPSLTGDMVTDVIKSLNMRAKSKNIEEFIMNGYEKIINR